MYYNREYQFDYAKKLKCMLWSKISHITNQVTHIQDLEMVYLSKTQPLTDTYFKEFL